MKAPQADTLFAIRPEPQYGVLVNEVSVNANRGGRDWWTQNRPLWQATGRLRVLAASIAGDRIELGPLSRDDAEFAAEHLVANGVPKTAVTVRRWTPTQ